MADIEVPELTSASGVTLAGTEIVPDKAWKPSHQENLVSRNQEVQIEVKPASAVALFFDASI